MIRDRFALAAVANLEDVPRNIDIVALWLAGLLTLGLLLTWVFIPRLPRWIVAGWGLILFATGIGIIITAPVPAGASVIPWGLIGLVVGGIVTIILSAVHSPASSEAIG
jgi:hypothetical protein